MGRGWGVGIVEGAPPSTPPTTYVPPPVTPPPPVDCGITDAVTRGDIADGLGVSDSGIPWTVDKYGSESSYASVASGQGILHYVDDDLAVELPFTDTTYDLTVELTPHFAVGGEILFGGVKRGTNPRTTNEGYASLYWNGSQWQLHVYGNGTTGTMLGGFTIVSGTTYEAHLVMSGGSFTATVSTGGVVVCTASASHTATHETFFLLMYPNFPYTGTDTLIYDNLNIVGLNRCTAPQTFDDFNRTVSGTWGTASSGPVWNSPVSSPPSLSVDGSRAVMTGGVSGVEGNRVPLTAAANKPEYRWLMQLARSLGTNEVVEFFLDNLGSGGVTVTLGRRSDDGTYGSGRVGMISNGAGVGAGPGVTLTSPFWVAVTYVGGNIEMRIWAASAARPSVATMTVTNPGDPVTQWEIITIIDFGSFGTYTAYIDHIDYLP